MTELTVSIPYPPSANRLWRYLRGKPVRSVEYVSWIKKASWLIKETVGPKMIRGPYFLTIHANPPDRRRRDLDNLIKPISDALVAGMAIEDDHLCQRLTIEWCGTVETVQLTVTGVEKVTPRGPGQTA